MRTNLRGSIPSIPTVKLGKNIKLKNLILYSEFIKVKSSIYWNSNKLCTCKTYARLINLITADKKGHRKREREREKGKINRNRNTRHVRLLLCGINYNFFAGRWWNEGKQRLLTSLVIMTPRRRINYLEVTLWKFTKSKSLDIF